jgi:GTPase SAR1 family protein
MHSILNQRDCKSPMQIALVGPPRSGKTLFLSHLKRMFQDNQPYAPTQAPGRTTLVAQAILESLSTTTADRHQDILITLHEMPDSSDRDAAHHILKGCQACLVLADSTDEDALDYISIHCKRARRSIPDANLFIVY